MVTVPVYTGIQNSAYRFTWLFILLAATSSCLTGEATVTWFERVPKVELHLHLEGAIPHEALWELIKKYGGDPSVPDLKALERKFVYRDFKNFMENWDWKAAFLREYEDFTFLSEAVARDIARQNIRYAEVFYSPSDFFRHRLEIQKLTEAVRKGLSRIQKVKVSLIADFVRDRGPENAAGNLAEINEVKELGVIGVTIGGFEKLYPPEPFAEVYEKARQLGFHTSAHAGETSGAESIWGAIHSLKVERIGHGTRAYEDDSLMNYLAEHCIPLEVCPVSNLKLGVVDSLKNHPVRRFFEQGIVVTINTDDPKMFGNSLATEYEALEKELGFSREDIRTLILNGIQASWLSENSKKEMSEIFRQDPAWLAKR
jgi:adenosine deaminase